MGTPTLGPHYPFLFVYSAGGGLSDLVRGLAVPQCYLCGMVLY